MLHKYGTWFDKRGNDISWIYNMFKKVSACYRVSFYQVAYQLSIYIYIKCTIWNTILLSIHTLCFLETD